MDTSDTLQATLSSSSGVNVSKIPAMNGAGKWTVNDTYGTLTVTGESTINADGSESITYTYSYAVNQSKTASLAEGETQTLKYTITVSDGNGNPVAHEIDINVQGTNDAPTINIKSEKLTLTLKDDGLQDGGNTAAASDTAIPSAHGNTYAASVEGTLTGKDTDHGATLTFGLVNVTSGTDAS